MRSASGPSLLSRIEAIGRAGAAPELNSDLTRVNLAKPRDEETYEHANGG